MTLRDTTEETVPVGVHLSIPLNATTHNLNGSARFDIDRSWSDSAAISINKVADDVIDVSVDVYNLGIVESAAFVNIVVHYFPSFLPSGGKFIELHALLVEQTTSLIVPAATPVSAGHAVAVVKGIKLPVPFISVSHVYAIAYDPIFDPPSAQTADLLALTAPLAQNPARLTRQVACKNVSFLRNSNLTKPFALEKVPDPPGFATEWQWMFLSYTWLADLIPISIPPGLGAVHLTIIRGFGPHFLVENIHQKLSDFILVPPFVSNLDDDITLGDGDLAKRTWYADLNNLGGEQFHGTATIDGAVSGKGDVVNVTCPIYTKATGDKKGEIVLRFLMR